jgi:hypothetical protein
LYILKKKKKKLVAINGNSAGTYAHAGGVDIIIIIAMALNEQGLSPEWAILFS